MLCCEKASQTTWSSEMVRCFYAVVIVVTGHDTVSVWLTKHAKPNDLWLSKLREENHRTEKFTTLIVGNMLYSTISICYLCLLSPVATINSLENCGKIIHKTLKLKSPKA